MERIFYCNNSIALVMIMYYVYFVYFLNYSKVFLGVRNTISKTVQNKWHSKFKQYRFLFKYAIEFQRPLNCFPFYKYEYTLYKRNTKM